MQRLFNRITLAVGAPLAVLGLAGGAVAFAASEEPAGGTTDTILTQQETTPTPESEEATPKSEDATPESDGSTEGAEKDCADHDGSRGGESDDTDDSGASFSRQF